VMEGPRKQGVERVNVTENCWKTGGVRAPI